MSGRTLLKRLLWGTIVLLIVCYSYFVLDDFVRGPRILLSSPISGFSTTTPVIMIVGRGVHTNNLSINGAQTSVDLAGNFESRLILAPGYNIIKVTAKDNYERSVEKTIEIVLVVTEKKGATASTTIQIDQATTTATSTIIKENLTGGTTMTH